MASTLEPRWAYLLAHHAPERYRRTFAVSVRSRTLHLCARCSGQLLGFGALLAVFFGVPVASSSLSVPWVLVAFASLPAPAAFDWLLQSTGRRESTNGIRFVTGTLLGVAFGGLIALLISRDWVYFLGGVLVLAGYFLGLLTALRYTGAWRRVLQEHFPDIALPPEA